MTRRGGKEASERSRRIGEDKTIVGSQVSGIDRSRLPGRTVRRGGRQEKGASDRTKKRVHRFRVRPR